MSNSNDDKSRLEAALGAVEAKAPAYADDLAGFVRIPSVSTDAVYKEHMTEAANWVQERAKKAGFTDVRSVPTAGNDVVVARWHPHADAPTVVFYGHYDVQPPEPLELWESAPFEPEVRDGKLYGRGASDDKGGVITVIQAVEAARDANGVPPINVTLMVEGEEEVGSPNLVAFLRENKDLLKADLAVSADGGIFGVGIPSVTVGSRGLAGLEVTVKGAAADLHSGQYGGAVANPAMALSRILASLQDENGVILVDGFYEGVPVPTDDVREALAGIPEREGELAALGLGDWWGEAEYSAAERRNLRPTLEVNGLYSGYQGPGIKTVLPSVANAKITCRLVGTQDPADIVKKLTAHIERVTPPGVTVTVKPLPGSSRAYQMPLDLSILELAADAMEAEYGKRPFPVWTGGTVPVAEQFGSELGLWCLYYAFGEPDNGLHAPNEFFRLSTLKQGTLATVRLLYALGEKPEAITQP